MQDPKRLIAKRQATGVKSRKRHGSSIRGTGFDDPAYTDEPLLRRESPSVQYVADHSSSLVTEDQIRELGTHYSVNPYRGCSHGCKYCYARPTHESFGLNAALDFETRIFIKEDAPELFREFLAHKGWVPEPIAMSAITDCYQPAERDYQLARACLEVAADFRQPMSILTKNALILGDRDLLRELASANLVHVSFSIATLDSDLARSMEPHTSPPAERLRAIRSLTDDGIPVRVLIAPIIPGLNESEIPALLAAAKVAGAQGAAYTMLRLPLPVEPVFLGWLEQTQPGRLRRIEGRLRGSREGEGNDPDIAPEPRGTDDVVRSIAEMFRVFAARYHLDGDLPAFDCTQFRSPRQKSGQLLLF